MCGIVGIWNLDGRPVSQEILQQMTNVIAYRGPDDEGYFVNGNFGMGSRRLSIIDLSPAGHMPMPNKDKALWITYNGEVYNYLELMADLKRNYHFRSNTDTETILRSYETLGVECLKTFNGMWAFAIWNQHKRRLVCARDRLGIKPFYYYFDGHTFIFASEIKAILVHPQIQTKVNDRVVYDYLTLGYVNHTEYTFFEDIKTLPAAHYLELNLEGQLHIRRWWDLELNRTISTAELPNSVEKLTYLLQDSIRLRLRSDVPIGTCLSGGLDSSSIVSIANTLLHENDPNINHRLIGERQKTFSACYEDVRFDERPFIEAVIDNIDSQSNYVFPDGYQMLWQEISDVVWHQEEPFLSTSIYAQWNVMRKASQRGVTVLLDGQGSDELMAGYFKYSPHFLGQLLRDFRFQLFFKELRSINAITHQQIGHLLKYATFVAMPLWFRTLVGNRTWRISQDDASLSKELQREFNTRFLDRRQEITRDIRHHYQNNLKGRLYADLMFFNLPSLLRYEDKNSMAFSIEARVPFLDHRLVEFVFSLPVTYLIHNGWNKWVLREAMEGILPEKVRWRRDKMGFVTPEIYWLRAGRCEILKYFSDNNVRSCRYLEPNVVVNQLDTILDSNQTAKLWRWLNLELWMRRFDLS